MIVDLSYCGMIRNTSGIRVVLYIITKWFVDIYAHSLYSFSIRLITLYFQITTKSIYNILIKDFFLGVLFLNFNNILFFE